MLKKQIKYTDYNGDEREEDFYFNLTKAEVVFMEMSMPGGITKFLERIINEKDIVKVGEFFREFVLKSYGIKSDDGKRFIKGAAHAAAFEQTEAFSELIMEMLQDSTFAAKFVNGTLPSPDADKPSTPPVI